LTKIGVQVLKVECFKEIEKDWLHAKTPPKRLEVKDMDVQLCYYIFKNKQALISTLLYPGVL